MASTSGVVPSISRYRSALRSPPTRRKAWEKELMSHRAAQFRRFCASAPPPKFDPEEGKGGKVVTEEKTGVDVSTYRWCAGLGALGLLETSYLTFVKISDVDAFCLAGGAGGCGDVLNSDYASVFGIPLPIFGMAAYSLVAALGLQLSKNDISEASANNLRMILLGTTTSMATASAYFLYILNTKLAGSSCPYCLSSAALSFSLFLLTLKVFSWQEIQRFLGLQLAVSGLIIASLTTTYSSIESQVPGDLQLDLYETEITKPSSPFAISLAKHLQSIGAKMYGAFWCSHCIEQKQMFGREAIKMIDYVECFPDGAGKGRSIKNECTDLGIQGFPTWVIKGEILSGEKDLQDLADAAGFVPGDSHP